MVRPGSDGLLTSGAAALEGSSITDERADPAGSGIPNGGVRKPRAGQPHEVTAIMFFRHGVAAWLERWSGRPTLVAVAAMNAISGLAVAATLAPLSFGADAYTFRQCASFAAEGRTDCGGTGVRRSFP